MAIYIKKVSVGSFLKKGEDVKDKDIVEIANEGKQVEGKFGVQDVFLIKVGGKEGNVNFNQTSVNNMIEAYGKDSVNWVGKKAKVWAILSNVQGKMIKVYYYSHPDADLDKDGNFIIPGNQKSPDEQLDEMAGEEVIDPKDIPFN